MGGTFQSPGPTLGGGGEERAMDRGYNMNKGRAEIRNESGTSLLTLQKQKGF